MKSGVSFEVYTETSIYLVHFFSTFLSPRGYGVRYKQYQELTQFILNYLCYLFFLHLKKITFSIFFMTIDFKVDLNSIHQNCLSSLKGMINNSLLVAFVKVDKLNLISSSIKVRKQK